MTPWVTRIIVANIAVFLAQWVAERARDPQSLDALLQVLVLVPRNIPFKPWTLVTYTFLHAGFSHIFFNMLSLYIFGPRLEAHLSGRRFLGLYLASGIAGGLLSWAFTPGAAIVGASGAILGVMFGYARYWPKDQIFLWVVPMQVRVAVVVMTVLDIFGGFGGGGNVAHFAHLGGFAGAFIYLRILDLRPRQHKFEAKLRGPPISRSDVDRWSKIQRDQLHEVNREEFDRIMQKIETEGVGSVTPQERTFLDNFSDRISSANG
jgi:membrane associated rhomboid family serine protease